MHYFSRYFKPTASVLSITLACLGLSACQTVQDQRIPLPNGFEQNAEVIAVRKPIAQYKDQHFEQNTPQFLVHSMNISRSRSQRSEQFFSSSGVSGIQLNGADRFTRFLWNEVLGMRPSIRQQYKLSSEREYRFQVVPNVTSNLTPEPVDVQCQLYQLSDVTFIERQERDRKGNDRSSTSTSTDRLYGFLRCELMLENQVWQLSLDAEGTQLPTIQLGRPISESATDYYTVEHEKGNQFLVNGQWRDMPFQIAKTSGLHFFKDQAHMAAMSFEGQTPKVWLEKSNSPNTKKILFAASYSLMMYDWLDREWRNGF
ncbi:hypothetical protein RF679_13860 [Undibacterium cyanobacteriorum]|uniref:Lipoprotein n=1 Tax=Undibacterium cyanobacteriorum TaxID=3073561 RepID=A0ABY9RES8_9BURK|nr:hypothetical protein [Undibacterium sp. 20NA77.5]WMW79731.1 hypothetical protein RF679_13860 [Undibacterium sp. 20NA77.5]